MSCYPPLQLHGQPPICSNYSTITPYIRGTISALEGTSHLIALSASSSNLSHRPLGTHSSLARAHHHALVLIASFATRGSQTSHDSAQSRGLKEHSARNP